MRTLLDLFPAHRENGLFDAYVRVVETGVPIDSGVVRYVDPDAAGGPLDQVLEHRAARMGDGYVLSVRDITERKAAEDEPARFNEQPRVTVSAVRAGDRVIIEVADNGIGIAPEHQEQVFEPFVRLHSSEAYPGTGIGLASVRKAARRMGSEVTLVSVPGEGSAFALELPAALPDARP